MSRLDINAKLYRNTGTYGAPILSEVSLISDLSVTVAWDEASADARESRIKQFRKTLLGLDFTGRLKKKIGDANYEAIMDAMLSDATLDLFILDGDKDTVGVRGWRCDAQIFSASEDQALGNVLYEDIIIKPSLETNPPKAVKVAAGPTFTYSIPGPNGGVFA